MRCSFCGCDVGSDFQQVGATRMCRSCSGHTKPFNVPQIYFVKKYPDAIEPKRSTAYSAGYDLHSYENVIVEPLATGLIKTGVSIHLPKNMYLGIHSRSGLALKKDVYVLNAVGVVDADYFPNEIGIIIRNDGAEPFVISKGDRIAQGVIQAYMVVDNDDADGERNGGFGSTGVNINS